MRSSFLFIALALGASACSGIASKSGELSSTAATTSPSSSSGVSCSPTGIAPTDGGNGNSTAVVQPTDPTQLLAPFSAASLSNFSQLKYTFYNFESICNSAQCDSPTRYTHVVMTNDGNYCINAAQGQLAASSAFFSTSNFVSYGTPITASAGQTPISVDDPATLLGTDSNGQINGTVPSGDLNFTVVIANGNTMQNLNYRAQIIFGTDREFEYGSVAQPTSCPGMSPPGIALPYIFFTAGTTNCDPNNTAVSCNTFGGSQVTPTSYNVTVTATDDPNFCDTLGYTSTGDPMTTTKGHYISMSSSEFEGECHREPCSEAVVPSGLTNITVSSQSHQLLTNFLGGGAGAGFVGVDVQDANNVSITGYDVYVESDATPLTVHVSGGAQKAVLCPMSLF